MKSLKIALSCVGLLLLTKCAHSAAPNALQPLPTDAVKTAEQAITIAAGVCREAVLSPSKHWTAALVDVPAWGRTWQTSASPDGNGACLAIRPSDGLVWTWDVTDYKPVPQSKAKCSDCVTMH
jgi:hypothetical protein